MSIDRVYDHFYRVPRASAQELSDGGGPFGFDITTALEFDYLIERYQCDAIIETGSNLGDTTHYLARNYDNLPVITCDVVDKYVSFVQRRLADAPNVTVLKADSREVVEQYKDQFRCPLFFLDAHWYEDWPLEREMALIDNGVVCIDDFDIGDPNYGFDEYDGVKCGPEMMTRFREKIDVFYTNNPNGFYPLPCLQTGRRGGKAFYQLGQSEDYFAHCNYFVRREFPAV